VLETPPEAYAAAAADVLHPKNAHLFTDYIPRPEVHASLTDKVFYANPNKASRKHVKPDVPNNPSVFPSDAGKAAMTVPEPVPQDIRRVQTRTFTSFKAGK
jgi:putrescine transport system substrate-binding protein